MAKKYSKGMVVPTAVAAGVGLAKNIKPKKKKGVFSPASAAAALRGRRAQIEKAMRED